MLKLNVCSQVKTCCRPQLTTSEKRLDLLQYSLFTYCSKYSDSVVSQKLFPIFCVIQNASYCHVSSLILYDVDYPIGTCISSFSAPTMYVRTILFHRAEYNSTNTSLAIPLRLNHTHTKPITIILISSSPALLQIFVTFTHQTV